MEGHLYRLFISPWSIKKRGHHRKFLFLIGRFLKFFFSEAALPNHPKRGRKHLWQVPSKNSLFRPDPLTNMAPTGDFFFCLADFQNYFPLKAIGQMNRNFAGSIYRRSSIKIAYFVRNIWKYCHHRQFLLVIGRFLKNLFFWNSFSKWSESW
jgi:hypothetical protein